MAKETEKASDQPDQKDNIKDQNKPDVGKDDGLIAVAKDGVKIRIHSATVKQHEALGWKIA